MENISVSWTPLASESLDKVVKYLEESWTEKELKNFLNRLDLTILRIKRFPEASVAIKGKSFRRAIVDKNNSVVYKVKTNSLVILYVLDSRQNPNKIKKVLKSK